MSFRLQLPGKLLSAFFAALLAISATCGALAGGAAASGTAEGIAVEPEMLVAVQPAREVQVPALPDRPAYTVYVPEGPDVPHPTVLVLHGMGGNGPGMATTILPFARSQGWTVVAPTLPYGDWRDPNQLTGEELRLLPQLSTLLDSLPADAGVQVSGKVMVFGFSRGAQAAPRYALLYPERVEAVAALSAGTYTLPVGTVMTSSGAKSAPLPFGVADFEQLAGRAIHAPRFAGIHFLIGVGAKDDNVSDVPRQWDDFVGRTRVERATRFSSILAELGCDTQMVVVPGTGHEVNGAMMEQVRTFLVTAAGRAQEQMEAAATTAVLPPTQARSNDRGV